MIHNKLKVSLLEASHSKARKAVKETLVSPPSFDSGSGSAVDSDSGSNSGSIVDSDTGSDTFYATNCEHAINTYRYLSMTIFCYVFSVVMYYF